MPDPWRSRKKCSPARRRFLVEPRQAAANRFSRITKHETRPLLWRGYGAAWAATVPRTGNTGLCFSRDTRHETRDTRHETRITAFMLFFPRLPGIAHDCPLKKCCKPGWLRNTAVDLAARDVSRALLRDSPAVRLSQRIMNQGLSWSAAQGGANSEVFTKHESRSFFAVGALGWRHRKPPSGPLRPPASHCFPVHRCSRLFTIVRHCSRKNIVWSQYPRAARSLLRWASSRGMARLRAAIARHARGEGGVGGEPVSVPRPPFSLGLATSIARQAAPAAANTNEPMLRKENVQPAFLTRRRGEVSANHESRVTKSRLFKTFLLERTRPLPMVFTNHETRITKHGFYGFHETRDTKTRLFFESRPLLWCGMVRLWRGMGGILPPAPAPLPRPSFSLSLTTRAVRWESRQSVQNPASPRKMRQAQRSLRFPSPSGLLPSRPQWRKREEGRAQQLAGLGVPIKRSAVVLACMSHHAARRSA